MFLWYRQKFFISLYGTRVPWVNMGQGQPGGVPKFPPFLWVKLWVGWVGRGYIEISSYFPASWINRVTLVAKIKPLYSLGYWITFESPKIPLWYVFLRLEALLNFFGIPFLPSSHVRSSLIGWSMCLKPFVKMCIFVVIQIFWSLRKYREQ